MVTKTWATAVVVKLAVLAAVPDTVVMAMGPVVAPAGTVALVWVAESAVKVALVPLKLTAVAPMKFVPVIVTIVPGPPLAGEKLVRVGIGNGMTVTVKVPLAVLPCASVAEQETVVVAIGKVDPDEGEQDT